MFIPWHKKDWSVVAIDHRRAIRDLDMGFRKVVERWMSYSQLAEVLVVSDSLKPEFTMNINANNSLHASEKVR